MITVKVTLTRVSSGKEVSTDVDILVGPRKKYHYVSQEQVTCEYNGKDGDITLFHKGERLLTDKSFSYELPIDWKPDIDKGSLLQVRVKGFKTFCSLKIFMKIREIDNLSSV